MHKRLLAASTVLSLALCGGTFAQSNSISIRQEGSGNTLTVDQSRADGSAVGGLTISRSQKSFTQPALIEIDEAGEAVVVQEAVSVDVGVLGASRAPQGVARQIGSGNSADVLITGSGGFVGLLQDNLGAGELGNLATASVANGSVALIGQTGDGNVANVAITGSSSLGTVLQDGIGNSGDLSVSGNNATGFLSQIGNGNVTPLSVVGDGTSVSYIVEGSNAVSVVPGGVQVISNGASVQITQSAGF